jgi:hypothetical protein
MLIIDINYKKQFLMHALYHSLSNQMFALTLWSCPLEGS